jgi:hypothetical protein
MSSDPSEGVFFVLRLPKGWQLCTCRHDEYGPLGLPDFWVEALSSFLNIWIAHFMEGDRKNAVKRHAALERALGLIVAGYDAFPRGEVKRSEDRRHYMIRYGGDLTRKLKVSRREIEEAFGIRGRAKWIADKRMAPAKESAQRLRGLLTIEETWEGASSSSRVAGKSKKAGKRRLETGNGTPGVGMEEG